MRAPRTPSNSRHHAEATPPTACPAPHPAQTHSRGRAEPHAPTSRATSSGPPSGQGQTLGRRAPTAGPFTRNSVVGADTNAHTARHSGQIHSVRRPATCRTRAMTAWLRADRQRSHRISVGVASLTWLGRRATTCLRECRSREGGEAIFCRQFGPAPNNDHDAPSRTRSPRLGVRCPLALAASHD
jgi:hypothetical protein